MKLKRRIVTNIGVLVLMGLMIFNKGVSADGSPVSKSGFAKFKSIKAGISHILALKEDGTVAAWGNNYYGECNIPLNLDHVKKIIAGGLFSIAIKEDNTVEYWGSINSMTSGVPDLSHIKDAAIGPDYAVFLRDDGTLFNWGYIRYEECAVPKDLTNVKSVAVGFDHTLALKEDGTLVAWGRNNYGQCDIPEGLSDVTSIAACGSYSAALKKDGTVFVWGNNSFGQCNIPGGLSHVRAIYAHYVQMYAVKDDGTVVVWGQPNSSMPKGLTQVKEIAVLNGSTAVALKEDGNVVGWGEYNPVQKILPEYLTVVKDILDRSDCEDCDKMLMADATLFSGADLSKVDFTNIKVLKFASGCFAVLKNDGTLAVQGNNYYGLCDIPQGLSGVQMIATGMCHILALKEDGTVEAWGNNEYGQCDVPRGLKNVKAIFAGTYHSIALKEDGTVVAWGDNRLDQCSVPEGLSGLKAIAAGPDHTVALKEDGTVVAWGSKYNSDLTSIPDHMTRVKSIAAGENHTLALHEDGTVSVWGESIYRVCSIPRGLTGIKAIAAQGNSSYALREDGTYVKWGDHFFDMSEFMSSKCNVEVSASPSLTLEPVLTPSPSPELAEFKVETSFEPSELSPSRMITAKVTATNVSNVPYSNKKDVLVIVGLYDANNTMVNVSYISKGIPYQGTETLQAGFKLLSNINGYKVRTFMWDGVDIDHSDMIPISNAAELD